MNHRNATHLKILSLALAPLALGACMERTVSYAQDVKPTLDTYCLECHQEGGAGYVASGLDMSTYESLMAGTRNGPMVIAHDSMGSNLVVLMEGRADPSIAMPHRSNERVSQAQIDAIKTWIDQGAENN